MKLLCNINNDNICAYMASTLESFDMQELRWCTLHVKITVECRRLEIPTWLYWTTINAQKKRNKEKTNLIYVSHVKVITCLRGITQLSPLPSQASLYPPSRSANFNVTYVLAFCERSVIFARSSVATAAWCQTLYMHAQAATHAWPGYSTSQVTRKSRNVRVATKSLYIGAALNSSGEWGNFP